MKNKVTIYGVLLFGLVINIQTVSAEMFKCVSNKGDVFYNDKPCPIKDKETLIKADKAPKNGYIPPAFVSDEKLKSSDELLSKKEKSEILSKHDKSKKERKIKMDGSILAGSGVGSNSDKTSSSTHGSSNTGSSSDESSASGRSTSTNPLKRDTSPRVPLKVETRKRLLIDR